MLLKASLQLLTGPHSVVKDTGTHRELLAFPLAEDAD